MRDQPGLHRPAHGPQPARGDRPRLGVRPGRRGDRARGRLRPPPDVLPLLRGDARALPRREASEHDLRELLRPRPAGRRAELPLFAISAGVGLGDVAQGVARPRAARSPMARAARRALAGAPLRRPPCPRVLVGLLRADLQGRGQLGLRLDARVLGGRLACGGAARQPRDQHRLRSPGHAHARQPAEPLRGPAERGDAVPAHPSRAARAGRDGRPRAGAAVVQRQRDQAVHATARDARETRAGEAMRPRVVHLIQRVSRGGAGRALAFLTGALTEFDHSVLALDPSPGRATLRRELAAADLVHVHFWNTPELYELLDSDLPPMRMLLWPHVNGRSAPHVLTPELVSHADMTIACTPLTLELPGLGDLRVIPGIAGWA